jgi:putative AbiEi antitoxin of type IV toxin-antitoxin system
VLEAQRLGQRVAVGDAKDVVPGATTFAEDFERGPYVVALRLREAFGTPVGRTSQPSCLVVVVRPRDRTVEQEMARIASGAHGVVTRVELLRAGVTEAEIKQRLRTGALLREHPGVYRVGHRAPSLEARYLAAVLACGDGARLSGRAAAHLLGLLKGVAPAPVVTARTQRRIKGVQTRRSRRMHPNDAWTWRGIPITTVARTLVDVAGELTLDDLARACHEAGVRHGTTPAAVERVLARHPKSPGAAKLRQVMRGDVHVTLSKLEARFLALLREAGLMLPQTNRPAGGRRVDCRWPEQRLTVELDSYRYHHSRHAWEQDRRREREARARGDEFRRYTYGDVFERPALMLGELRALVPPFRPTLRSQDDRQAGRVPARGAAAKPARPAAR